MQEPSKDFTPFIAQTAPKEVAKMGLTWLVIAAIATSILWQVPGRKLYFIPIYHSGNLVS